MKWLSVLLSILLTFLFVWVCRCQRGFSNQTTDGRNSMTFWNYETTPSVCSNRQGARLFDRDWSTFSTTTLWSSFRLIFTLHPFPGLSLAYSAASKKLLSNIS